MEISSHNLRSKNKLPNRRERITNPKIQNFLFMVCAGDDEKAPLFHEIRHGLSMRESGYKKMFYKYSSYIDFIESLIKFLRNSRLTE